ncbi:VIN3-like protein 2 [Camellia lanceoleosa]|uniref:VIN3-like protein 2 n=1 Tax=Camellia lanceoleosa TaxID=1840588 RepID=A0ACC0I3L0_9ERIC|nr:VIN3-like protein 2 [Camellia lanceoleosa]
MSCHLECALRHEKSGIAKDGMDGRFCCLSCGKVNDLLGCWRKQLMMAKDTRRVDILCYRVSLSQKLLAGTKYYKKLYEIVDEAVKKLEADVGHLTGLPVKMARGIVNRLSSGPEVQRLCACAVESLDLMLSKTVHHLSSNHVIEESNLLASNIIQIEDVCTSSVMVVFGSNDLELGNVAGYTLWHRRAENMDYPSEPSGMFTPNTRFLLSGLSPATEYVIKVVFFDSTRVLGMCEIQVRTDSAENELPDQLNLAVERSESESPVTNCSGLSNPSSVEDETNNIDNEIKNTDKIASAISSDVGNLGDSVSLLDEEGGTGKVNLTLNSSELNIENKCSGEGQTVEEASTDNGSNTHVQTGMECVPFVGSSEAELPVTPCKLENFKDGLGRNGRCKPKDKDVDSGSGREEEPQAGSSSKKRSSERQDKDHSGNGDRDFEHYVKVIRWLECEGHIETTFRQKFLTWYSLRATPQEMRVVKVFVDTLVDDPASLAGQLVDTFSEAISSKRSSVVPSGFCLKLWH